MEIGGKRVLVCDCEGTMPLDARALGKACGGGPADLATQLCGTELGRFVEALRGPAPLIVACTQESPRFEERREEAGSRATVRYVNIRERAGWSREAKRATPKIAALLAEAAFDGKPAPALTLKSAGVTLIYGKDEAAIDAAKRLADRLDVTVLLMPDAGVAPPRTMDVPVVEGRIKSAKGHLGAFELIVDQYAAAAPSSRATLEFGVGRDGARSACDLILDLSGGVPLFPHHEKRDGYVRADTGNAAALEKALARIADLVGEFDKPRYVTYRGDICAHARSKKTGCTRCLDVCPAGAIVPKGDRVEIDPHICAGCGSCAAVCPTGAASFAYPAANDLAGRLRTLLNAYHGAGGEGAVVLVHDAGHGEPLIDAAARFGDGLPARVLPFGVFSTQQIGLEFFAAAFALGAAALRVLVPAKGGEDRVALAQQFGLAEAALGGLGFGQGRLGLIETDDPEAMIAALGAALPREGAAPRDFLPLGDKRGLMKLALAKLHEAAPAPVDIVALPKGAPLGAIKVDVAGCTLCLACVAACPAGALSDDPDRPKLSFLEDACVQCGLCKATCPEKVIELVPRLDFKAQTRGAVVVKAEEPYACIRCGKAFGTKSTVEAVIAKLSAGHWMYRDPAMVDRMKMCGDCRIVVQSESALDPYAGAPRPHPRTNDEYQALHDLPPEPGEPKKRN